MIGRLSHVLLIFVSLQSISHISAELPAFVTSEIIEMVQDDKVACMNEFGTTQDIIDQVNDGVIANDPKLTCYMNCLLESFGVIDEDSGDFEYEMLLGFFPEDIQAQGRDILGACAAESGADKCEKIYKIAMCIQSKAPGLFFML